MAGSRTWKQQLLRVSPQTGVNGRSWQRITYGMATGNGAADGTTVVSASTISGAANTYNGKYYIEMVSGTCKGQWKRIVEDDGAGNYTVENNGFSDQIDSTDQFCIWKCPDLVAVAEAGSLTTTTFIDSSLIQTNPIYAESVAADGVQYYWHYVIPIHGTNRGEAPKKITGFSNATGTFTFDAFSVAPAEGDIFEIGLFAEAEVTMPSECAYHPRLQNRVNHSVGDGTVGGRGGTLSITTRVSGSENKPNAGNPWAFPPKITPLLRACGVMVRIPDASTIGGGSTTTAIKIATGSWENHRIGDFVMWNGNIRQITAIADGGAGVDTITVEPAMPSAPVSADVLYGLRTHYKQTDPGTHDYGCAIQMEVDGIRALYTGCMGNVTFNATQDGPIEATFELSVDHWVIEKESAAYNPSNTYPTYPHILTKDIQAWRDTTAIEIGNFTCTPGFEVAPMSVSGASGVNGRAGFQPMGYKCGATYREIMDDSDELEEQNRFFSRTADAFRVVYGSHYNAFAFSMPVARSIQFAQPSDEGGLVAAPVVLEAQDAGTYTEPDGTIRKKPDWAFAIT